MQTTVVLLMQGQLIINCVCTRFLTPNNLKSPVHDLFDYKLPIPSYEFRDDMGKKMKKKLKQTKRGYRT